MTSKSWETQNGGRNEKERCVRGGIRCLVSRRNASITSHAANMWHRVRQFSTGERKETKGNDKNWKWWLICSKWYVVTQIRNSRVSIHLVIEKYDIQWEGLRAAYTHRGAKTMRSVHDILNSLTRTRFFNNLPIATSLDKKYFAHMPIKNQKQAMKIEFCGTSKIYFRKQS